MAQLMTLEEQVVKVVVDEFGGRVVIRFYLIAYHFHLFVYLALRINAVKDDVCEHVNGAWQVLVQQRGIIHRVGFCGVGIQVSAHALQGVDNLQGVSALRTLEGYVLAEVCQPLFAGPFASRAGSYLIAAVNHRRG